MAPLNDTNVNIKSTDMTEDMQHEAIDVAKHVCLSYSDDMISPLIPTTISSNLLFYLQAIDKWTVEKDIAAYIKKEFDSKHGPTWHCIVGKNFGSYVTHESKHFIYFYLDSLAFLLFKSG